MEKKTALTIIAAAGILIGGGLTVGFFKYYKYKRVVSTITRESLCNQSGTTTDCSNIPLPLNPPTSYTPSPTIPPTATISSNPVQSGKIDEYLTVNNTLRDVNFCGKTYRVKQVIIDGVDVAQRISELATNNQFTEKNLGKDICKSIVRYMYSQKIHQNIMSNEMNVSKVKNYTNESKHKVYSVFIGSWRFHVNINTADIYLISGYDGSLIGPIGKLK